MADTTEAVQLGLAAELLEHAAVVIFADGESEPNELGPLAADMSEALRDTLRVAKASDINDAGRERTPASLSGRPTGRRQQPEQARSELTRQVSVCQIPTRSSLHHG